MTFGVDLPTGSDPGDPQVTCCSALTGTQKVQDRYKAFMRVVAQRPPTAVGMIHYEQVVSLHSNAIGTSYLVMYQESPGQAINGPGMLPN